MAQNWILSLKAENIIDLEIALKEQLPKFKSIANETVDAEISEESDFVQSYFKASPEMTELFDLWNFQISNQIVQLECLVLDILCYAVVCSKRVGFRSTGTAVTRRCIREYMATILRNLNSGKHVLIQSTLRLLVALVMHGVGTTRELMDHFNFTLKSLGSFLKIRKKYHNGNMTEDIRTLYIRFLLGFIIRGDSSVKQAILDTKMIPPIFKELKDDPYWNVDFVLSTVIRGIVNDVKLSKQVKLTVFSHSVLESLVSLYNCSTDIPKNVQEESSIPDCVHSFLNLIFCSPKVGLFSSKEGWGTIVLSQKHNSTQLMLKLLQLLKIVEDPKQKELFLGVLQANPELCYYFWQNSHQCSFEPRSSIHFLANVSIAVSAIQLPIPDELGCKVDDFVLTLPPNVSHCLASILPQPLTRIIFSKSLQSTARDVRFASGQLLIAAFKKLGLVIAEAEKIIAGLSSKKNSQQIVQLWATWKNTLMVEVRQRLPDPQVIIALHKSSTQKPDEDDELSVEDMQVMHFKLLQCYQVYNQDRMYESRFDYGKLIPSTVDFWSETVSIQFLEILMTITDFKWWNKSSESQRPHITFFLFIYLSSSSKLQEKLEAYFMHTFSKSYLFQEHSIFVFSTLRVLKSFRSLDLVTYVGQILSNFGSSPFDVLDNCSRYFEGLEEEGVYISKNLPFAPILFAFSEHLASFGIEFDCFIASLVIEQAFLIPDCRVAALASLVRSKCVKKSTMFQLLLSWLESFLDLDSSMAETFDEPISYNDVCEQLEKSDSDSFMNTLMRVSPSVFKGKWDIILTTFERNSHFIHLYMMLKNKEEFAIHDLLETSMTMPCYLNALFSQSSNEWVDEHYIWNAKLEKYFEQELSDDYTLFRDVSAVLFYCYSWITQHDGSISQPVMLSLAYLGTLLSDKYVKVPEELSKLILQHPLIVQFWLSIDNDDLQNVLTEIVSVCLKVTRLDSVNMLMVRRLQDASKFPDYLIHAFQTTSEYFPDSVLLSVGPFVPGKVVEPKFGSSWLSIISKKCLVSTTLLLDLIEFCVKFKGGPSTELAKILRSPQFSAKFQDEEVIKRLEDSFSESYIKTTAKNEPLDEFLLIAWFVGYSKSRMKWICDYALEESWEYDRVKHIIGSFKPHLLDSNYRLKEDHSKKLRKLAKTLCQNYMKDFLKDLDLMIHGSLFISDELLNLTSVFVSVSPVFEFIVNRISKCVLQDISNPHVYFKLFRIFIFHKAIASVIEYGLWLVVSYFQNVKKNNRDEHYDEAIKVIEILANSVSDDSIENSELVSVAFMVCLKYQFTNASVLKLLQALTRFLSTENCTTNLDLIMSHSAFPVVMQGAVNESSLCPIPIPYVAKPQLLQLILKIMSRKPQQLCQVDQLKQILKYFFGTISEADKQALEIFKLFERNHISIAPYVALWGNQNIAPGSSHNLNESINQIDSTWMLHSIHWMPTIFSGTKLFSSGLPCLYDADFFISLLCTIFDQQIGTLDPHRLIESNVIGVAIIGLSHESLGIRKACHYILSEFYGLVVKSNTKERNQTLLLLDMLKNAIVPSENDSHPIIPSLIAMFFAHALSTLSKPESFLYPIICKFTLQRPIVDLEDVPIFYELFYSSHLENRLERMWMLKLLLHGLNTTKDYLIFQRRHVMEILFDYFQSPLADTPGRKLVMQIIYKASMIPSIISSMITKSGLLQFLKQCCGRLIFGRPNDITLAIPRLVLRVLKRFLNSPTSWDGPIDRSVWIQQFSDISSLLLSQVSNLPLVMIDWETALIHRTVELGVFFSSLPKELDCQHFVPPIVRINITNTIKTIMEGKGTSSNDCDVVQDEFDIDSLFVVPACDIQAMFLNLGQLPVLESSGGDDMDVE